MPMSSFELAMQTTASVLSDYLEIKLGVPVIPKDGINKLVKKEFPHFETKEISPGRCKIRIQLPDRPLQMSETELGAASANIINAVSHIIPIDSNVPHQGRTTQWADSENAYYQGPIELQVIDMEISIDRFQMLVTMILFPN